MKKETIKLDQLTSLRFFAALMIVFHHSIGLFGIKNSGISFDHGVSFFFVLSGFILTYVYPSLNTWTEIKQFWRARIARIWPAYFASFLIGIWLASYSLNIKTAVPYLLMMQAWLPFSTYYFSYNAVSWSVSTEFFFYLVFPILIYKWNDSWWIKLCLSISILIAIIMVSNIFSLPDYGDPSSGSDGLLVTQHGLLYISPLSRVLEFIFGMSIALVWQKSRVIKQATFLDTSYELGTIALCIGSMYYTNSIAAWSQGPIFGIATSQWLVHSGSMLTFGLLIFVMARGRGAISKILQHPFLVLLGEISFSLYMIHQILLTYYAVHTQEFSSFSNLMAFSLYLIVLLFSSYLMWVCIEMPGRRFLIGKRKIHGTAVMKKSWHDHAGLHRKPFFVALALCCVIGFIHVSGQNPILISAVEAEKLTPSSFKEYVGITFGKQFTLRGLDVERKTDGLYIKLAWESKTDQDLTLTNAIHLLDDKGEIQGQADYKQSIRRRTAKSGDIWLDEVFIPAQKINNNVNSLAIALYEDLSQLLPIDRGTRDWNNHRLIIQIDSKN